MDFLEGESIKLLQGDCLDIMRSIPTSSVDLVLTDPPYGTTACKWDSVIDFDLMWAELKRVIKPNGAIVLFGSEPFSSALRMSNIKQYKYDWKWEKDKAPNFGVAKYRPMNVAEDVMVFYGKTAKYNPQKRDVGRYANTPGKAKIREDAVYGRHGFKKQVQQKKSTLRYPVNVIKFNTPKHNDGVNGCLHPTQKPVALMEYLIKTYTDENETVLDFTMGSGSTGVAAKNLNRRFIGIELDPNYFAIAKNRIESA